MKRVVSMHKIVTSSIAACLSAAFAAVSVPASAYEEDTHFTVTYILCRAMKFTNAEALMVAEYDQGMDDSSGTVANGGTGGVIPNIPEEHLWHAIPTDGKAETVLKRKQELWEQALNETNVKRRLQRLGVFFHYQQDTWAHRHHPNHEATNFEPYTTPFGHAAYGHQPDRPPFDPVCALRCLEDGLSYARTFSVQSLGRAAKPMFDNYQPAKGEEEKNWKDSRNGGRFHQLASDASTPAHKFCTDIIRAQIDAYTNSHDALYGGYSTANQANYADVKQKLTVACLADKLHVSIPDARTKITTLTTERLQSGQPSQAGTRIKIKSVQNGQYMCVPKGISDSSLIYCRANETPLEFSLSGDISHAILYANGTSLCLNYRDLTGAVKLFRDTAKAQYKIEKVREGVYTLKSLSYNQYIWLSGDEPYLTRSGEPKNKNAQWIIEGLP